MRARSVLLGVISLLVVGVVVFVLPAGASIVSVSGQIVLIAPPPSVQFGALQSDDHMFAFDEQQNVTLPADLPVDISQPGQYGPNCGCDPLTPGTIPAGTVVSSQFVHADPIGTKTPATVLDATVVTSTPIIGIEVCGPAKPSVCGGNKGLDDSDAVLGAPGTLYPTGDFGRGMNFDTQNDFLVWMIDNHTVEIQTSTALHVDQVRIITAGSPPPPPKATIVVKKVTVPSGDPAQFSFSGDLAGSIGDGGTISKQVDAGTYSTTEAVPAGWSLTSISCDDAGSSGNVSSATATFNVAPGQTVTCTFTDTKNLAQCTASSIASNFNGTAIKAGNWIWFNAVTKISGVGTKPVTLYASASTITFSSGGTNYTLNVPNAQITVDPSASQATTSFDTGTNTWKVTVPKGLSGNTFLDGLGFQVPVNISGGTNPVTWNATFKSDTPGISFHWQWGAAVYTSFNADNNGLGVKPTDDNNASVYKNSDHAGTPENYKQFVVGGARGGGGSNFTGSYSGTGSGSCQ